MSISILRPKPPIIYRFRSLNSALEVRLCACTHDSDHLPSPMHMSHLRICAARIGPAVLNAGDPESSRLCGAGLRGAGPRRGHPWNVLSHSGQQCPKKARVVINPGDLKQSPSVLSTAVQPGKSIGVNWCDMKHSLVSHAPRTKLWRHLIQCPPLLVPR